MRMTKIPFIDIIATMESLSADKRIYPIEYWNYENTDIYETTVNIQAPAGITILEYPADKELSFKQCVYSVKFVKKGNQLKIIRKANLKREDIKPDDYDQFKKFFNDIVAIESKYIVFK